MDGSMNAAMAQQAVAHGLEERTWHVPVFTCAELANDCGKAFGEIFGGD